MAVALFDLDQTLLAGDSEYLWGLLLARRKGADVGMHERESYRFYEDYLAGRLDFEEYMGFQLRPMADCEPEELLSWRDDYINEVIAPRIAPQAPALLDHHRARGDTLVIITASNGKTQSGSRPHSRANRRSVPTDQYLKATFGMLFSQVFVANGAYLLARPGFRPYPNRLCVVKP